MGALSDWRTAFPTQSAVDASEALLQAWTELASTPRRGFNARTKEPALTKRLKVYLENYVSRERGLLGMWAAENIIGEVDPVTGVLVQERRTDIVYGWNDHTRELKLVFEFKRLGKSKQHRDKYLGDEGLARFVTGIYSRNQPVAAMVGILLAPYAQIVPHIQAALSQDPWTAALRLRHNADGIPYSEPSTLFPKALFDTHHARDKSLSPSYGYIHVAHFFLTFGNNQSKT